MGTFEYILSAFRCLSASKMRTFLTTLGIIVGISSVILINTIGGSLAKTIVAMTSSMFSGNQALLSFKPDEDNEDVEYDELGMACVPGDIFFSSDVIRGYEELFDSKIDRVVSEYFSSGFLSESSKGKPSVEVFMVTAPIEGNYGLSMLSGRFISDKDNEYGAAVAVISDLAAKEYFGDEDPIGKKITFSTEASYFSYSHEFTVVGIYKNKRTSSYMDDSSEIVTNVYTPWKFYEIYEGLNIFDYDWGDELLYDISDIEDTEKFKNETIAYLTPYYEDTGWHPDIYLMTDMFDTINSVIKVITLIIAGIAAISLIVGGIGVMNIMLVSVTERTMEIGVRKAMGAENNSIRLQFITESVIISFIGSALGIIIGLVESKLIAIVAIKVAAMQSINLNIDLSVPYSTILSAVFFSFAVGIIFGVYPAEKAAKMEVVDALRYE